MLIYTNTKTNKHYNNTMSGHHHRNDKVIIAKTVLMNVLGENSKYYLNFLKLWFRQRCTKEVSPIDFEEFFNYNILFLL